jgi:hypothetical protein
MFQLLKRDGRGRLPPRSVLSVVLFDFFPDVSAAFVVTWQRAEGSLQLRVLMLEVAARDPCLIARIDSVNKIFSRAGHASKSDQLIARNFAQYL